jgi:hypothetical protein
MDVSKKFHASYGRVGDDTAPLIYLVMMGPHRLNNVLVSFRDGPVYRFSSDVEVSIPSSELIHAK